MMEMVMDILLVLLSEFLPILAAVVGGYIAVLARKFLNIELDAKQRQALHSAIETGMGKALARKQDGPDAEATVLRHVKGAGAAEAVRRFNLDDANLIEMIKAKSAVKELTK